MRGQYGPGYINGNAVIGYREEDNVARDSNVETFAALKSISTTGAGQVSPSICEQENGFRNGPLKSL